MNSIVQEGAIFIAPPFLAMSILARILICQRSDDPLNR